VDLEPLGQALAAAYTAQRPYATVTYLPGDWESGPAAVARRSAEVGLWAGLPTDGIINVGPDLTTTLIARDAIAVVVAPYNPVVSLSLPELQTMFAGRTPNWQEVGGNDQEVQTICWYDGARLRLLFDGLVMRDRRLTPTALVASSNEGVQALVSAHPNAIGYMHWRAVSAQVRALSISGVLPTASNISTGQYPLSFPVVLVTEQLPGSDVRDFVRFVRSSEGQAIVIRWLAPAP
jgi:phosphate transport system substrate-binding protein